MHYAITNSGGFSPNVVQPKAEVLYLLRAPKLEDVKEVYERVNDIARGAALMTGTQVEIEFIKACSNIIPNDFLTDVVQANMETVALPVYTEEEIEFANAISNTLTKKLTLLTTSPSNFLPTKQRGSVSRMFTLMQTS